MVVIDATPTQNEHRHRGIGHYVGGLLHSLVRFGDTAWRPLLHQDRAHPEFLSRFKHSNAHRPAALRYHGNWLFDEVILPVQARLERWDAFHATDPRSVPDPRLVPLIATIYDLTPLTDAATRSGLSVDQRLAYRRALANALHARAVVTISQTVRRQIMDLGSLGSGTTVEVVYPGIDPGDWQMDLGADRRDLLYVGAPAPHKGVDILLDALTLVPAKLRPGLNVIGPWSPAAIDDAAVACSTRGLAPPVFQPYASSAELRDAYGRSVAVVLPSRSEGFGMPVLEAMAAGCPALISDLPVLREVAGDGAIFFPVGDSAALARELTRFLGSRGLRAELAARGRVRAARFTWQASVEVLEAVYSRVVPGRS